MLPVLFGQEYGKRKWHDRAPKWHMTTRRFMVNYLLLILKEGEALENQRDENIPRSCPIGGEEDSTKYT